MVSNGLGGTVDSADYGADIRLTISLPAERHSGAAETANGAVSRRHRADGNGGGIPSGTKGGNIKTATPEAGTSGVFHVCAGVSYDGMSTKEVPAWRNISSPPDQ